jgi:hypothetical protein
MIKRTLMVSALATALILSTGFALAADKGSGQERVQTQKQEQIYGSQLMTKQERAEYRNTMRATKTAEKREQIRKRHRQRMRKRARVHGLTLPDTPSANGGGMSRGSGMGSGGGDRGSGGGRGR